MNKYFSLILFFFLSITLSLPASANNLELSGFDVVNVNTSSQTITFQLDLTQGNSWRNTMSHDAVWVFMKYSTDAGMTWNHASMSSSGTNPAGFAATDGFEIIVPTDEKGFFFQRSDFGAGNISAEGVQFVWDYGQDGLSNEQAQAANTIHNLYGVEMVYIPEGAFYAGDGASNSEYRFKQGSSDDDAWYVSSESVIVTSGAASDAYYYQNTGANNEDASGASFIIPNSFPKGYKGFYLMKYELTEGQWVSFFNTLTDEQKSNRDLTASVKGGKSSDAVVNRNALAWDSNTPQLPATTDRPARALSYISWPDLAAYADWAGLRPITELEFEKASRGVDIMPKADEYAWGTSSYEAASASEIYPDADEDGAEAIFDSAKNLNRNSGAWTSGDGRVGGPAQGQSGPLRVGIFAENSTTRETSGAGYYGNMELSGNLAEPVVTIGRLEGRQFLGSHGDGTLTTLSGYEGNATNTDWPGINTTNGYRGITGTVGIGYRGGDYQSSNVRDYQTSSRGFAAKDPDSQGWAQRYDPSAGIMYGGRLGRTAP